MKERIFFITLVKNKPRYFEITGLKNKYNMIDVMAKCNICLIQNMQDYIVDNYNFSILGKYSIAIYFDNFNEFDKIQETKNFIEYKNIYGLESNTIVADCTEHISYFITQLRKLWEEKIDIREIIKNEQRCKV